MRGDALSDVYEFSVDTVEGTEDTLAVRLIGDGEQVGELLLLVRPGHLFAVSGEWRKGKSTTDTSAHRRAVWRELLREAVRLADNAKACLTVAIGPEVVPAELGFTPTFPMMHRERVVADT